MEGLTEGRMVHFVMPNGEHRPAVIVRVWRDLSSVCEGYVNLQVFTDGANDARMYEDSKHRRDDLQPNTRWETSICHDEDKAPGTWHWIERA